MGSFLDFALQRGEGMRNGGISWLAFVGPERRLPQSRWLLDRYGPSRRHLSRAARPTSLSTYTMPDLRPGTGEAGLDL